MRKGLLADQAVVEDQAWSVRMADSAIKRHSPSSARWHYEHGFMLKSIEQVWLKTGTARYWDFIKATIDLFIDPDGNIRTYSIEEYNLDQVNPGKLLFSLYRETGDERYRKALALLREQLRGQPRLRSGGFWHKQIYPYQMWLDSIYMAAPFYTEYARTFDEPAAYDDILLQIRLIEQHARDQRTGLIYHAWDESKQQRWANPETGCSPHFWGRGMGWYAMALVDVLDHLPTDHPEREFIIANLVRTAEAITPVQDPTTGLWYQVLDQGYNDGNYLEASGSSMFVYALAKGVRKAYLPITYLDVARHGYMGITQHLVSVDDQGMVTLENICAVAGLGGNPYRDGSYTYYVSEKVMPNDYKGVGAFIMAAIEIERAGSNGSGPGHHSP